MSTALKTNNSTPKPDTAPATFTASDWMRTLMKYRTPMPARSVLEIIYSIVPLLILLFAAYMALSVHILLSLVLSMGASVFLVRMFMIQHDCSHGAFFKSKKANIWVGRCIGVLTVTPFAVWRRAHLDHHASAGNLDKRGIGDINTLTVREYKSRSKAGRFAYRLYRHPLVLFLIGPIYIFLLSQRLPDKYMRKTPKFWISAMGTNLSIVIIAALIISQIGAAAFFIIYLPMIITAGSIGVWLFYVQHQFEETRWDMGENWNMQDAALFGSSHYDLPQPLRWITANIGIHHVHHLNARIPFYRLSEALRDHPKLKDIQRLTFWRSFSCVKLKLWHEEGRRLISFKQAKLIKI